MTIDELWEKIEARFTVLTERFQQTREWYTVTSLPPS